MKVLNLYAGIGGNRKLWPNNEIEVTAVEINSEIAEIYKEFFPEDKVIVTDAHQYLLEHYKEFDFIWSSPPCPSHSKVRNEAGISHYNFKVVYPDLKLYEEIILLNHLTKLKLIERPKKFVVENVVSYYKPLIRPQLIGNHFIWANFKIDKFPKILRHYNTQKDLQASRGFYLSDKKIKHRKDQILRNCVEPKLGLHIFNNAFKEVQKTLSISSREVDK